MPQIRCVDLLGQYWPQISSLFWEKRRCRGEDRLPAVVASAGARWTERSLRQGVYTVSTAGKAAIVRAGILMNKSSSSLKRNESVKRDGWHRAVSVLWGAAGMVRIACGPCAVGSAKRCTRSVRRQNQNRTMSRQNRDVTVVMIAQMTQSWLNQRGALHNLSLSSGVLIRPSSGVISKLRVVARRVV